jgi:HSP20 family protein
MNTSTKSEERVVNGVASGQQGCLSPRVNILETKDGYVLEAEMPGVGKDGLKLSLEGNELTIVGSRQFDLEDVDVVYRESSPRCFKRVFELDPAIDTGKISAVITQGVLTVNLPKAEKAKPRKITVSG